MKNTSFNFWQCSRVRILCGLAFFVMIGLYLIDLKKTETPTPETVATEQPLEKTDSETSLERFDEKANSYAPCQHTANKDTRGTNPSKQNLESLRYAMQRDASHLTFTKNPDGSKAVFLNGTFKTVSAAKRLPDGTLEIRCFESFEDLENFMVTSKPD